MNPQLNLLISSLFFAFCNASAIMQSDVPDVGTQLKPSDTIIGYLMKDYGINVEEHWITTADGYVLGAFRITRQGAPVVILQHGVLGSAWCWLDNKAELSSALQLYEAGFDVWLTNSRGNTFSTNHSTIDPNSKAFWNFTFAKMGHYDVPANVRYVLNATEKQSLSFVGWSQGSSQFFVAMQDPDLKLELERSVNLFVALSPVTRMGHSGGFLKIISDLRIGALVESVFPYGFLNQKFLAPAVELLCKLTAGVICKFTVDLFCGTSSQDNPAAITNMTAHFPAGISVKGLDHYEQLILDNRFGNFNYGQKINLEIYGQKTPPDFDISNLSIPTALFMGKEDLLGDPADVAALLQDNVGNRKLVFNQTFEGFSHVTWMVGKDKAFNAWYPKMLALLQQHSSERTVSRVLV